METMRKRIGAVSCVLALSVLVAFSLTGQAGSLEPSGPPGPTMKTLDEIEPRTPIDSLPFVIDFSGSYYVTGDLLGSPFADGITINADNVTLDLSGFTLTGVLEVQPNNGIDVNSVHENITIHNGVLRSWSTAVDASAATNSQIRNLRVEANAGDGIRIGAGSSVVQCSAKSNTGQGIDTGDGCSVIECTARSNSDGGIATGNGSTVMACTASSNPGMGDFEAGIRVGSGSTVTACTANNNGNDGIFAWTGSTVTGCTTADNGGDGIDAGNFASHGNTVTGCTAYSNEEDGIVVGVGGTVRGCTARSNTLNGILATDALIHGNSCTGNTVLQISALGTSLSIENHTLP